MEMQECGLCYGNGLMDCPVEWGEDYCPNSCPACAGDQKVLCTDCEGTGEVEEY